MEHILHSKKIIRKVGTSEGIIFNSEERKVYGLKAGDIIYITVEKKK